jgi:hypothetical protein
MSMTFVNLNGEAVSTNPVKVKRAKKLEAESFHKGFRVVGIPPGAYEQAVKDNKREQETDKKIGGDVRADLPPYEQWANQFKPRPVRAKPYEIQEAAAECARLAVKAGWDRVQITEIKRDLRNEPK